ncbi:MAG TPA: hypothetical protein VKQ29_16805, partial [Aliidongia sp.]|nr:hypothetical protein [Aliidongia sp.]
MIISPSRFWVAAGYLGTLAAAYIGGVDFAAHLYGFLSLAAICVLVLYRFDYLNPLCAFCWPWLAILGLGGLDMSELTRPIGNDTILLLLIGLGAAITVGAFVPSG